MDSPWRRLPWTLSAALLVWAAVLWVSANFMGKPVHRPVEPPPIDVQLVEQPAPVAAVPIEPEPPAAAEQPKPPPPVPVKPQVIPRTTQKPVARKAKVITRAAAATGDAPSAPSEEAAPAENTSPNSSAQAGSYDPQGSSRGDLYANSAARAIVQPKPQIPEDLRVGAFISAALVRFHIAVDGSAEVELAKPTQEPRLNRILLDTLKKWRFMPAIKSGKPVPSIEEILVKIEVK